MQLDFKMHRDEELNSTILIARLILIIAYGINLHFGREHQFIQLISESKHFTLMTQQLFYAKTWRLITHKVPYFFLADCKRT